MNVEPIRKILPYTTVALVIAALYAAYTYYSRWAEDRRIEAGIAQRQADAARKSVEMMGGENLKILNFYASPPVIQRGTKTKLCYGVANAKTVRIEPETERVWPAYTRCFEIAPGKTTTYTLTAEDGKGRRVNESVDVTVQ